MMITAEQSLDRHGPIRVFDGDGNELKNVTAIDFETGEVIEIYMGRIPFWYFYLRILDWLDKKINMELDWSSYRKHYFAKTPMHIEACRKST